MAQKRGILVFISYFAATACNSHESRSDRKDSETQTYNVSTSEQAPESQTPATDGDVSGEYRHRAFDPYGNLVEADLKGCAESSCKPSRAVVAFFELCEEAGLNVLRGQCCQYYCASLPPYVIPTFDKENCHDPSNKTHCQSCPAGYTFDLEIRSGIALCQKTE